LPAGITTDDRPLSHAKVLPFGHKLGHIWFLCFHRTVSAHVARDVKQLAASLIEHRVELALTNGEHIAFESENARGRRYLWVELHPLAGKHGAGL
jgi:hypothetical protein